MSNVILQVDNLKQYFRIDRKTTIRAVDNVSFKVYEGEIFSVVGESGSGKSTLGRSLIRIYDANAGEVTFLGKKITGKLNGESMRFLRKNMQMIFQDPMASLNPRKKFSILSLSGWMSLRKSRPKKNVNNVSSMC
jgi:oligopeptide transport system ATP-binding protein